MRTLGTGRPPVLTLAFPQHAGLCYGRRLNSLATRGNKMELNLKRNCSLAELEDPVDSQDLKSAEKENVPSLDTDLELSTGSPIGSNQSTGNVLDPLLESTIANTSDAPVITSNDSSAVLDNPEESVVERVTTPERDNHDHCDVVTKPSHDEIQTTSQIAIDASTNEVIESKPPESLSFVAESIDELAKSDHPVSSESKYNSEKELASITIASSADSTIQPSCYPPTEPPPIVRESTETKESGNQATSKHNSEIEMASTIVSSSADSIIQTSCSAPTESQPIVQESTEMKESGDQATIKHHSEIEIDSAIQPSCCAPTESLPAVRELTESKESGNQATSKHTSDKEIASITEPSSADSPIQPSCSAPTGSLPVVREFTETKKSINQGTGKKRLSEPTAGCSISAESNKNDLADQVITIDDEVKSTENSGSLVKTPQNIKEEGSKGKVTPVDIRRLVKQKVDSNSDSESVEVIDLTSDEPNDKRPKRNWPKISPSPIQIRVNNNRLSQHIPDSGPQPSSAAPGSDLLQISGKHLAHINTAELKEILASSDKVDSNNKKPLKDKTDFQELDLPGFELSSNTHDGRSGDKDISSKLHAEFVRVKRHPRCNHSLNELIRMTENHPESVDFDMKKIFIRRSYELGLDPVSFNWNLRDIQPVDNKITRQIGTVENTRNTISFYDELQNELTQLKPHYNCKYSFNQLKNMAEKLPNSMKAKLRKEFIIQCYRFGMDAESLHSKLSNIRKSDTEDVSSSSCGITGVKLSGAQKKKVKEMVGRGISRDLALIIIERPANQAPDKISSEPINSTRNVISDKGSSSSLKQSNSMFLSNFSEFHTLMKQGCTPKEECKIVKEPGGSKSVKFVDAASSSGISPRMSSGNIRGETSRWPSARVGEKSPVYLNAPNYSKVSSSSNQMNMGSMRGETSRWPSGKVNENASAHPGAPNYSKVSSSSPQMSLGSMRGETSRWPSANVNENTHVHPNAPPNYSKVASSSPQMSFECPMSRKKPAQTSTKGTGGTAGVFCSPLWKRFRHVTRHPSCQHSLEDLIAMTQNRPGNLELKKAFVRLTYKSGMDPKSFDWGWSDKFKGDSTRPAVDNKSSCSKLPYNQQMIHGAINEEREPIYGNLGGMSSVNPSAMRDPYADYIPQFKQPPEPTISRPVRPTNLFQVAKSNPSEQYGVTSSRSDPFGVPGVASQGVASFFPSEKVEHCVPFSSTGFAVEPSKIDYPQKVDKSVRPSRSDSEREPPKVEKPTSDKTPLTLHILPISYPDDQLYETEMDTIESSILDAILKTDDNSVKPSFKESCRSEGRYIIICNDEFSMNWVREHLKNCESLLNVPIKILAPYAKIIANAVLPPCSNDSTEKILRFIANQNKGLNVNEWKVLQRWDNGDFNTCLELSVDEDSAKVLEGRSTVNFKLTSAQIVVKRSEAGISSGLEDKTILPNETTRIGQSQPLREGRITSSSEVEPSNDTTWSSDSAWQRPTPFTKSLDEHTSQKRRDERFSDWGEPCVDPPTKSKTSQQRDDDRLHSFSNKSLDEHKTQRRQDECFSDWGEPCVDPPTMSNTFEQPDDDRLHLFSNKSLDGHKSHRRRDERFSDWGEPCVDPPTKSNTFEQRDDDRLHSFSNKSLDEHKSQTRRDERFSDWGEPSVGPPTKLNTFQQRDDDKLHPFSNIRQDEYFESRRPLREKTPRRPWDNLGSSGSRKRSWYESSRSSEERKVRSDMDGGVRPESEFFEGRASRHCSDLTWSERDPYPDPYPDQHSRSEQNRYPWSDRDSHARSTHYEDSLHDERIQVWASSPVLPPPPPQWRSTPPRDTSRPADDRRYRR